MKTRAPPMTDKVKLTRTMTLNLPVREMDVLATLAAEQELTKTQLMRQALKLYQLVTVHARNGEYLYFSGDRERQLLLIAPGIPLPAGRRALEDQDNG